MQSESPNTTALKRSSPSPLKVNEKVKSPSKFRSTIAEKHKSPAMHFTIVNFS